MLNKNMPINNMKIEMQTIILTQDLVNDNSLLQLVKTPDNKTLLRCRFIDQGYMNESVIHEFTDENIARYSVFYTQECVGIFNKDLNGLYLSYQFYNHYSLNCSGLLRKPMNYFYQASYAGREATKISVEKDKTNFTLSKTILPKSI